MKKLFKYIAKLFQKPEKLKVLEPEKLKVWDLQNIESNFESLKESQKKFEFKVPVNDIKNGILVNLKEKTIGFQKDYCPYNWTILEFTNDCLFCNVKESRSIKGIVFKVKAKEMIIEENEIKKLVLTVM